MDSSRPGEVGDDAPDPPAAHMQATQAHPAHPFSLQPTTFTRISVRVDPMSTGSGAPPYTIHYRPTRRVTGHKDPRHAGFWRSHRSEAARQGWRGISPRPNFPRLRRGKVATVLGRRSPVSSGRAAAPDWVPWVTGYNRRRVGL
ncbi:hypothetical protein A0H81_02822 [Grifola frondosa]|uniref:Uncharacterized protein n=1 Tax=Grifola frondosa TaxID=5627 RepID=A0A1C7MK45_GRIFR|nr:hypothetical protein A0H81_02822 [Grifola frondosa]